MRDPAIDPEPLDEPALPAGLVEALGGLHGPGPAVPAEIDRAILADARAGFARRRRFWLSTRAVGAAAAGAAAAVIVIAVYLDRHHGAPSPVASTRNVRPLPGDIDGNGRVDILDALLLAKRIEASSPGPASADGDVNGDGVVDRRDVDAIAARAVSVDGAGTGAGVLR